MKTRLTLYEMELMDVLWRLGEASVQEVSDHLNRDLAYTSIMTTLSLLHEKKQVLDRVKRGRAFVYRPTVTRDEVSRSVIDDLRGVLFQGSTRSLVLSLLADEQVTPSDIEAIKKALSQLESAP